MNKILILGGSGFIGSAIAAELKKHNSFEVYETYCSHKPSKSSNAPILFPVQDYILMKDILHTLKPDIVISSLRGSFDTQLTIHIETAEYLKKQGGHFYFLSTANVFDHNLDQPHYENEIPKSISDYGLYKISCEKEITDRLGDHACILRLPQIWGTHSPRMNTLLNSLRQNDPITVCPQLFFNTNTDEMTARQIYHLITSHQSGIFHLSAEDIINHKLFYVNLITKLGFSHVKIREDLTTKGNFSLLSNKTHLFPANLHFKNEDVINHLVGKYRTKKKTYPTPPPISL